MTASRGGADTRAAVVLVLVVAVADAVPPGELRLVAGPALMSCAPAHAEAGGGGAAPSAPAGRRPALGNVRKFVTGHGVENRGTRSCGRRHRPLVSTVTRPELGHPARERSC